MPAPARTRATIRIRTLVRVFTRQISSGDSSSASLVVLDDLTRAEVQPITILQDRSLTVAARKQYCAHRDRGLPQPTPHRLAKSRSQTTPTGLGFFPSV